MTSEEHTYTSTGPEHPEDITMQVMDRLRQVGMLMHRPWASSGRPDPLRGQGRILAILALKPQIEQRDLGYLLGLSKQALGEQLMKLENAGFVTRTPSPEDGRRMVITITPTGQEEAQRIREQSQEGTGPLAALQAEELQELNRLLGKILDSAGDQLPNYQEHFERRRKLWEEFMQAGRDRYCDPRTSMHHFQHMKARGFTGRYAAFARTGPWGCSAAGREG